jgi:hypothetical protein
VLQAVARGVVCAPCSGGTGCSVRCASGSRTARPFPGVLSRLVACCSASPPATRPAATKPCAGTERICTTDAVQSCCKRHHRSRRQQPAKI